MCPVSCLIFIPMAQKRDADKIYKNPNFFYRQWKMYWVEFILCVFDQLFLWLCMHCLCIVGTWPACCKWAAPAENAEERDYFSWNSTMQCAVSCYFTGNTQSQQSGWCLPANFLTNLNTEGTRFKSFSWCVAWIKENMKGTGSKIFSEMWCAKGGKRADGEKSTEWTQQRKDIQKKN